MTPQRDRLDFTDVRIDEFIFIQLLGSGAFADVWLAEERDPSNRVIGRVAIKVFQADASDRASFRRIFDNFHRDLRFLSDLAPNNAIVAYRTHRLVTLYVGQNNKPQPISTSPLPDGDTGWIVTVFLIVMELADGGCLDSAYRNDLILDKPQKPYIRHFLDICSGLLAAHKKGIFHRDIKPQNLLWFRNDDQVKITDFGTAQDPNDVTLSTLDLAGSLHYMSPESFVPGSAANAERDIYALGCTFYELLTGKKAFTGSMATGSPSTETRTTLQLFRSIHENAPRPDAVTLEPNIISLDLSDVIKQMMSIRPDARPRLEDVIDALKREIPRVLDLIAAAERIIVPNVPTYHSSYDINPQFRFNKLKEGVFFVFISLPVRTEHKLRYLFGILEQEFGMSFSIVEVFGRYDFVLRVWAPASGAKVRDMCLKIVREVLDDYRAGLHVMVCEDAHYSRKWERPSAQVFDVMDAFVKLHGAQKHNNPNAIQWLREKQVYVRDHPRSVDGPTIRCYCLISTARGAAAIERGNRMALLRQALGESSHVEPSTHLSIYMKADKPMDNLENETADYVISYVAESFQHVIVIPGVVLDLLKDHRVQTATLLSTKRTFVESDRWQPSGEAK